MGTFEEKHFYFSLPPPPFFLYLRARWYPLLLYFSRKMFFGKTGENLLSEPLKESLFSPCFPLLTLPNLDRFFSFFPFNPVGLGLVFSPGKESCVLVYVCVEEEQSLGRVRDETFLLLLSGPSTQTPAVPSWKTFFMSVVNYIRFPLRGEFTMWSEPSLIGHPLCRGARGLQHHTRETWVVFPPFSCIIL